MDVNEKIDSILKYLNQVNIEIFKKSDNPFKGFNNLDKNRQDLKTSSEIGDALKHDNISIENSELNLILFHLANEEKCILLDHKIYNGIIDTIPSFRILLAGKIIIENGGYTGKTNQATTIANNQKRIERNLLVLNIIIALGTTVSAMYYLHELWKAFH